MDRTGRFIQVRWCSVGYIFFTELVTAVQKKSQQLLHVRRKLQAFDVDPTLFLGLFYSIFEPVITYCGICYYPTFL